MVFLSPTLPDLSSYSYRDEWLVWLMFFPLQNFIQCEVHFRNLVETWCVGQSWDAQWSWGRLDCIWHTVFPWHGHGWDWGPYYPSSLSAWPSLAALQEGPSCSLLQILPLLKHSVIDGVGPSGDKGMPKAEASREIKSIHCVHRIKVRALKEKLLVWQF